MSNDPYDMRAAAVKKLFEELEALRAENARLREIQTKASEFINDVYTNCVIHGCEYDGGTAQDKMVELGIIDIVIQNGPCCDTCNCANITDGPEYECYRIVKDFNAARAAMGKEEN